MLWYIVGTVLHSLILSELDLYNIVHVLYPKDQGAPRVSMAASDNFLSTELRACIIKITSITSHKIL